MNQRLARVERFRALHASGCFALPNPWDEGSAVFLERIGFQALASTSSGFAFARARPDEVKALPLQAVLEHLRALVDATTVPVQADFQNGYADDPDALGTNVALCLATGVAGLSIEDATGDAARPLYERALAIERVRAARAAIDASGVPVVLTARCEAWLVGADQPLRLALDRLVAFAVAGADCLYAPGVREVGAIEEIVRAVAPKPVNVLVSAPIAGWSMARLAELGVRRVSVGSALARAAWGGFMRAARTLAGGSFEGFEGAATFAELNALFNPPSPSGRGKG